MITKFETFLNEGMWDKDPSTVCPSCGSKKDKDTKKCSHCDRVFIEEKEEEKIRLTGDEQFELLLRYRNKRTSPSIDEYKKDLKKVVKVICDCTDLEQLDSAENYLKLWHKKWKNTILNESRGPRIRGSEYRYLENWPKYDYISLVKLCEKTREWINKAYQKEQDKNTWKIKR